MCRSEVIFQVILTTTKKSLVSILKAIKFSLSFNRIIHKVINSTQLLSCLLNSAQRQKCLLKEKNKNLLKRLLKENFLYFTLVLVPIKAQFIHILII